MDNTFKNIINAAAFSSSNFVQKLYENEKDNFTEELNGVKFETTITILDENNVPIAVSRATTEIKNEAKSDEKIRSKVTEKIQEDTKNYYPKKSGNYYQQEQFMPMPYMMPMQPAQQMPMPQVPVNSVPVTQMPYRQTSAVHQSDNAPVKKEAVAENIASPENILNPAETATAQAEKSEISHNENAEDQKQKIENLLKRYSNV